jgi:DNA helicase II / ATP-dependent DNA helicase PcrA
LINLPPATEEQLSILNLVRGTNDNILINSFAGTGKTTTLQLIQGVIGPEPILYLCFNKRVAKEAETKFPSTTQVRTFNSLGHRIWAKTHASKLTLNGKKTQENLAESIKASPRSAQAAMWDCFWNVVDAVARAKAVGYVPNGKFPHARRLITEENFYDNLDERPDDLVKHLTEEALFTSIQQAYKGYIDFNDQIYMPALFGGTYPNFPIVKVDETQDLNPSNHAMLDILVRNRLVAVGDPFQSIYGFRGAMQGGMASLKEKFKMVECDLSISFRCPQAVVEAARWRVPQFKWMKPGGHFETLRKLHQRAIPDDAAIICRNNAPLFKLALHLLRAKRSVSVAGSDVGPKVVGIMKKLGDSDMSRESLVDAIYDWRAEKMMKKSTSASDIADCMVVFASFGKTLGQAVTYAEHLFSQQGSIQLLTGHKAKGMEWDTVYHLDPWIINDEEQDLNLRYVITTRAKERLFEINSLDIEWQEEK